MPTNAQTIAHSLERGTISDGRFTLTRTIRPAGATTGEGGMVFAAGELQRHDWSMANTWTVISRQRRFEEASILRCRC